MIFKQIKADLNLTHAFGFVNINYCAMQKK